MARPSASEEVQVKDPALGTVLAAEAAGTFVLVFGLISTAIFAAGFPEAGVGFLGVALALGISVTISAYAFGPISGGHFNPAVTVGLAVAGRFSWNRALPYILAQIIGGALGAGATFLIASTGPEGFLKAATEGGFASNGFGDHSPGGFGLGGVIIIEVITTAIFLLVILGVTHKRAAQGFAPIAIGATLTLLALIAIPVSNGSFNPARSIATAIYAGGDSLAQVWVFIVFPIVGAAIAGLLNRAVFDKN